MPRTVPAGISALVGAQVAHEPVFLMKWELGASTYYYSSREAITYGGATYAANRIKSIPSFEPGLIDRKTRDFTKLEIELSNLADDGSANFPFTGLVGATAGSIEDGKVTIYAYSRDAADAVLVWWGYSTRPTFSSDNKSVTIGASFFWDAIDFPVPYKLVHQTGFAPTDAASRKNDNLEDEEATIPILYGVAGVQYRPYIYDSRIDGTIFHVNFIVSGCNGVPFQPTDLLAADIKLFGVSSATTVEFLTGSPTQAAPGNLTRFADGAAHPNIAYAYAAFLITNEIKDKLDDINSDDIKIYLANARPLLDTTLPSENAVLIIKDLMRDPNFGLGIPNALFDAAAIANAANYIGTRYQVRYELREKTNASERIQKMLGDCHCFITFDNGLIQIRAKKNVETVVASFKTIDAPSGSGRRIYRDDVNVSEKDSSELVNQVTWKWQKKSRHRRVVTLYDDGAQKRAGGVQKKIVETVIDEHNEGGVCDEGQAAILGAILVREEQNGDLFVDFSVPFWEGIDVAPGDLINVYAPDIYGASNFYRVIKQEIETSDLALIKFSCQVYKVAIYNDDTSGLNSDLLHGGNTSDSQARAPDVIPTSLTVVDVVPNDVEGKDATVRGVWSYPTVDLATEQAAGQFREFPIAEVELWWRFTDEKLTQLRRGATAVYPATSIDFIVPFYKTRSIETFFVAIGHNRARSPFGFIPDSTKVTYLTSNLSATSPTAAVAATLGFSANDYVIIEKETARLTAAAPSGTTLNFVQSGGNRTAQMETVSIAHPSGTEVAVARKSYPSITIPLDRRFTYPVVSGLIAISTGDGVRFKWQDPNADNVENFILYWSTDADALTNPAKLGTTTPAWYFADPWTPPAGVNLEWVDDRRVKLTQAEIGGANLTVAARVVATIHRNFSSAMSNSATGVSTGATAPPVFNPSDPSAGDLVTNIVNTDTERADAYVEVRIWADGSNHAHTFADCVALNAIAVFKPTGDTDAEPVKFGGAIADPSQTSIVVGGILPLGQAWTWLRNVLNNGAGSTRSNVAISYQFVAGGLLQVEPGDAKTVPAPGFGTITREDGGNKIDLVPVYLKQDGVDVVYFKHLFLDVAIPSSGTYNRDRRIGLKGIEHLYVTTTVTTAGSSGDITVPSTTGFDAGPSAISIENELILYTSKTATTFVGCTRGAYGTGAVSHTAGVRVSGAYHEVLRVKRKAAQSAQYRIQSEAVGGKLSAAVLSGDVGTTTGDGATAPGAMAAPTLSNLLTNTVDGDPDKNLARCMLQLFTANGLGFLANNIRQFGFTCFEKTFDDSAPLGQPMTFLRMSNDYTGSNLALDFYLKIGRRFEIVEVYSLNGDKQTTTACSVKFFAGGLKYVDPLDTFTVPAPTFQVAPAADGTSNKLVTFTIRVAQNGTDIVWFKQLIVEVTYDGGSNWRSIEGSPLGLKFLDDLHASAVVNTPPGKGFHDFSFSVKRKAGTTFNVRCQAVAVGGKASALVTFGTPLGSSAGDVGDDTAAPSGYTGPTFRRLKKNGLKLDLTAPTTNALKLRNALVYIANNVHGSATLWVNAADVSTSTASEAAGAISTAPTGGVVIPVDRQMLETIFGVGATVYVYAQWANDFGVASGVFSTASTFSLAQASGQAEVGSTSDQVAPGTPPAPAIKEQYGSIVVKAKPPSTGANQITKWQVAICDANSAPTTADPPTATAGSVFAYEEAADGVQKFRFQYAPAQTRYFFSRCQNASFPGTWSNWSSSTSISGGVITRPLQDEIGGSAPSFSGLLIGNRACFTDVACTTSAGFSAPMNAWDDGVNAVFEFYLPVDSTGYSLISLEWQRYRQSNGALRDSGTFNPSLLPVLRIPLPTYVSSFRFRIRNKYRVGGVSGNSFWMGTSSNVYIAPGAKTGTLGVDYFNDYDPGVHAFAESDYYVESAYPTKYSNP